MMAHILRRPLQSSTALDEEVCSLFFNFRLGTVRKCLKFFSFSLREKGGEGVEAPENTKPEKKTEETQGGE